MANKINELSVFLPTYNEEGNIKRVVGNTKRVLQSLGIKWELIIVNDGSKDKTLEIVEGFAKEDKRIRVLNHKVKVNGLEH